MTLRRVACWALLLLVSGGGVLCALMWQPMPAGPAARQAVPSLTAWGKIFSFLLLATLGVAYLVWRRPIVQARAILETSPLGTTPRAVALVDWVLYVKTLLVAEALAMGGVIGLRVAGRALSAMDTAGVVASAAIVAFVVHLLLLSRRGGRSGS